jgi:hypothetical protein
MFHRFWGFASWILAAGIGVGQTQIDSVKQPLSVPSPERLLVSLHAESATLSPAEQVEVLYVLSIASTGADAAQSAKLCL